MKWLKIDQNAPSARVDFIREWVRRLYDPTAKQCKGVLMRKNGSACCLGVASGTADLDKNLINQDNGQKVYLFDNEEYQILPKVLKKFLSMNGSGDFIGDKNSVLKKFGSLAEANDQGVPFIKIARAICTHPDSIFRNLTDSERKYIIEVILPEIPTWSEHVQAREALREQTGKTSGEAQPS